MHVVILGKQKLNISLLFAYRKRNIILHLCTKTDSDNCDGETTGSDTGFYSTLF